MDSKSNPSLWKNKTFVKMFLSFTVTNLGDWIDYFAILLIFAYKWHASPFFMGILIVIYMGPGVLFGQIAGVLADRFNKLRLMITSDLVSGILTLLLIFAPSLLWATILLLIRSTLASQSDATQQALVRHVVDEELLLKATTTNAIVFQLAKVVGPLIGALIVTILNPQICLLVNGISFFASALILFSIRLPGKTISHREDESQKSIVKGWQEGWKTVITSRIIVIPMITFLIGLFLVMVAEGQTVVLLRLEAPSNPSLLGQIMGISGVGSIIGIIFINMKKVIKYGWLIGSGAVLLGLGYLGLGLYKSDISVIWLHLAAILQGLGVGIVWATYNYLLQKESSKHLIGRVMGINNSMQSAMQIIGPFLGGVFVTLLGVHHIFQSMGILVSVLGLAILTFQKFLFAL